MTHESLQIPLQLLFGSTVILSAALVVTLLSRKRSASFRHAVWAFAMLGALLLPVAVPCVPRYPLRLVEPAVLDLTPEREFEETMPPKHTTFPVISAESSDPTLSSKPKATQTFRISWPSAIIGIWLLVAAIRLGGLIASRFFVRKLLTESRCCDDELVNELFDRLCRKLRIAVPIRLVRNSGIPIPFAVGVFRPVIVLPGSAEQRCPEELESMLMHELSHIVRYDMFWQGVAQIVTTFYWFHPLAWFGLRRMRIERELACDDAVLFHGLDPAHYADVLLESAAGLGLKPPRRVIPACAIAMARSSVVRQRIESILSVGRNRKPLGRTKLIVLGSFAIMLAGFSSVVVPFEFRKPMKQEIEDSKKPPIVVEPGSFRIDSNDPPENETESPPETVRIRGRVFLPDGSPAKNLFLASYLVRPSRHTIKGTLSTDENGYYSVRDPVPVDSWFGSIARFQQGGDVGQLKPASSFFAVKIERNMAPDAFDLRLYDEGILLHGKLTFEDGRPAPGKKLAVDACPLGEEKISFKRNDGLESSREISVGDWIEAGENGEYRVLLRPGRYKVSQSDQYEEDRKKRIELKPGDKEYRLDLTVPPWTEGTVYLDNGEPASFVKIEYASQGRDFQRFNRAETDVSGRFSVALTPMGNLLQFQTKDKSQGLALRLDENDYLGPLNVKLQKPEKAKFRLLFKNTNKPVAGAVIRYEAKANFDNRPLGNAFTTTSTDQGGNVEFPYLYPGGTYLLTFDYSKPCPAKSRVIDLRITPYKPGETIDYGDVFVDEP